MQISKRRKLSFEEKKAAVEIEERRQVMVERANIIDLLAALAKKLAQLVVAPLANRVSFVSPFMGWHSIPQLYTPFAPEIDLAS